MNKKSIVFWISLIIIMGVSGFFLDSKISFIFSYIQNIPISSFILGILILSPEWLIILFITFLFIWKKDKRKWIFPLEFTIGISIAISFFLKLIFSRARPFQQGILSTLPVFAQNTYLTWNTSFPSFHAMMLLSVLPLISKKLPKMKIPWIIFTTIILFSRLYFGIHFITDIIFGSIIGYLLGYLILKIEEENHMWRNLYYKIIKY